jgi:hypothetical protein
LRHGRGRDRSLGLECGRWVGLSFGGGYVVVLLLLYAPMSVYGTEEVMGSKEYARALSDFGRPDEI